ncbi:MAG: hypothetical protein L0332_17560 [Chloroflexi bacterium]|nr:hypothetical protein [Chloroflexota bacterium]MCI0648512.1 hypothetical protein [Chloroflexota bacterium]MCI0728508.1 hypothetical protein [Chloroflexota bacterium]
MVAEKVLGAMLLTGAIRQLCQECQERLAAGRATAEEIGLPTWVAYFDLFGEVIQELSGLFSLKKAAGQPGQPVRNAFAPYTNTLAKAVQAAEDYLLSDLTFREGWDTQRHTLLDRPKVVARAFPVGLVVETLCANGHDMSTPVVDVFRWLAESNFGYWEGFSIQPDADCLGLLLRLFPYSPQKESHHDLLQRPLRWLAANILPSGEIPVFFQQGLDGITPETIVWGNNCVAVEVNALLGLIAYDWEQYQLIIEKSALNLFSRLVRDGLSPLSHYPPPYGLWGVFNLMAQLSAQPISPALQHQIEQAGHRLRQQMAQVAQAWPVTAQNAAFCALACLGSAAEPLFDRQWITRLLKSQRYDGGWDDEALYPTAARGGQAQWYSSRTVTTAFCYHALQTYQRHTGV